MGSRIICGMVGTDGDWKSINIGERYKQMCVCFNNKRFKGQYAYYSYVLNIINSQIVTHKQSKKLK